ncbi:hypothetical protein PTSG_02353 [Salpingoeca rosetta]|uniref:Uncharacterized protein n=1 Tax=Salpingoeca rosetta (strain ATCC 50818 / BSB-021) TaxID=946362 RepID=F2U1Y5_SALR5|nr:uncharacterized protein PTSG_02353 [Salpingoeca rosetta]EGD81637.1 hypothetical protein PTSG_02353 [Salpingoeca rosetta]|eukprot:XP_004996841.1 hypothetical protein PTSG_02353 [Salpingoeca rosetta]
MADVKKEETEDTATQPLVPLLAELHQLAATTKDIHARLDDLLELSRPAGDAETAKEQAMAALSNWKKQLAKMTQEQEQKDADESS